ncbi:hypothetical protein C8R44DRAFT_744209 [Mycena epipterygia]|nr:hypothetical protein C8R44DRAFT_744209 [Mycena epipterygia]
MNLSRNIACAEASALELLAQLGIFLGHTTVHECRFRLARNELLQRGQVAQMPPRVLIAVLQLPHAHRSSVIFVLGFIRKRQTGYYHYHQPVIHSHVHQLDASQHAIPMQSHSKRAIPTPTRRRCASSASSFPRCISPSHPPSSSRHSYSASPPNFQPPSTSATLMFPSSVASAFPSAATSTFLSSTSTFQSPVSGQIFTSTRAGGEPDEFWYCTLYEPSAGRRAS